MRTCAIALTAAAAALLLAGCGGSGGTEATKAEAEPTTKTLLVNGYVDTPPGPMLPGMANDGIAPCADNDPGEGSQVVIESADGTVLGTSELREGAVDDPEGRTVCSFRFSVDEIPSGAGPYVATVSETRYAFDESEAASVRFWVD